ncbi:universal stress protein [Leifsonia sp. NPDC080035]|uniref:Universal stress protein n=1 Tax=Leifsonia sp. NPDC080035 TaxID=3143936 RepID=A0AAU7GCE5_9MICO
MSAPGDGGPVIAAVHPGQSTAVVAEGARLAAALGRPLLCAHVAEDSYLTEWDRPEVREEASLHPPTAAESDAQTARAELEASIAAVIDGADAAWSLRVLGGDPAKALARVAEELDARLLVVGTRQKGFGAALEEFLTGSVAAKLAHEQDRPVVVVPVSNAQTERLTRRR